MESPVQSARHRNRASAACTTCRRNRIRCTVPDGQNQCSSCQSSGAECVFDDKDGRKNRKGSKAVADGLNERIQQLESLLKQQSSPQAQHARPVNTVSDDNVVYQRSPVVESLPSYETSALVHHSIEQPEALDTVPDIQEGNSEALMGKLAPSPVRFDMASGRVRFFGQTASMHILSNLTPSGNEDHETHWPIGILMPNLSPETHTYLMDLYWNCHNSNIHLVHEDAFYQDQREGRSRFYSTFLHFCLLATGFSYADKSRQDIRRLSSTGQVLSSLHARAKDMARSQFDRPGGIPSIQAFFLLGALECSVGRDDAGWMFAGMAFRLVWDLGLHVDASVLRLSEREAQIRHMVLWACLLNDKYWALYLGRPTTLKTSDIAPSCLAKDLGKLIACKDSSLEKTRPTRIYEALLQLMDLVGPLCQTPRIERPVKTTDAYFRIAALDRDLSTWYSELPQDLQWTAENIAHMPPQFFLLHSQYHALLILLHRPFVHYGHMHTEARHTAENERISHFTALSRSVCIEHAKHIASIFRSYRGRFNISQLFSSGMTHIGTAATALMAEIINTVGRPERKDLLEHLKCLNESMIPASKNAWRPAILMSRIVDHFIKDFSTSESGRSSDTMIDFNETLVDARPLSRRSACDTGNNSNKRSRPDQGIEDSNGSGDKRARAGGSNYPSPVSFGVQGLPFLPSSWLDEMDWQDMEFLNLVGLKDLQNTAAMGWLDGYNIDPFS